MYTSIYEQIFYSRALEIVGPGRICADFQDGNASHISIVDISSNLTDIDVFLGKFPKLVKVNIWGCDPKITPFIKAERPRIEITECAESILSSVVDFQQKHGCP